jgi:siderophore synthetase component
MVRRRMPPLAAGEVACPFAALAAPSPVDGRPIATELVSYGYGGDPLALVDAFGRLMLPPLLALLDLGVALEAHGQNLLVVVKDHRPVRLLYRDMGGLRISPVRLAGNGIEAPALRGDLVTDEPDQLRTKLVASAVGTVLFELVAVLARAYGIEESAAWERLSRTVPARYAGHLATDTVPVKAMTAMRLAAEPLHDQWAQVRNPMAEWL